MGALARTFGPDQILIFLVGLFGGAAHALPEQAYLGGAVGPFDILVFLLLVRWALRPKHLIDARALSASLPFYILTLFAYIGEINGGVVFGANTWAGTVAHLRFLYYPTIFFTLLASLTTERRLRLLFGAYICGVLSISVLALLQSPDPTFFFGFPVLNNPNVIGNFISYALICLGFGFMPKSLTIRGGAFAVFFSFAVLTFSKATWLLSLIGLYVNLVKVNKLRLTLLAASVVAVAFFFADWQALFKLASDAIDIKLASSVGNDETGGTVYMRAGFLLTSLRSLLDHPLGVGLKNFRLLNDSYAHDLGNFYFESDSPHAALGYMAVQAGWVGVGLLVVIFYKVLSSLYLLYGNPSVGIRIALAAMLVISILFQIEFLMQPFIYLVLAAAIARRRQLAEPVTDLAMTRFGAEAI